MSTHSESADTQFENDHGSLALRASRGAIWTMGAQLGTQGLALVSLVVLGRLLEPSDYGAFAAAMVVIGFALVLADAGLFVGLLQRPSVTPGEMKQVQRIAAIWSSLIAIVLFFSAHPLAQLLGDVAMVPMLRLCSLSLPATAFGLVARVRKMHGNRWRHVAAADLVGAGCGLVAGTVLALRGADSSALGVQFVLGMLVSSILLNWGSRRLPGLPRPTMSPVSAIREARGTISLGLGVAGFNALNYWARNFDNLLVGRVLGLSALGIYTRAYLLLLLPLNQIQRGLSAVVIRTLADLQDDQDCFKAGYLRIVGVVSVLSGLVIIVLLSDTRSFVMVVLGDQWLASIPLIRIFAVLTAFQAVATTAGWLYQATGRSTAMFRWGVASTAVIMSSILCGAATHSLVGLTLCYAIAAGPVLIVPTLLFAGREVGISPLPILSRAFLPVSASLLGSALVNLLPVIQCRHGAALGLSIRIALAVGVYGFILWASSAPALKDVRHFMRNLGLGNRLS
jgi:O-antigen/teichoic acid export membrane protein